MATPACHNDSGAAFFSLEESGCAVGRRVSLVLYSGSMVEGTIRKLMKRTINILNHAGMVQFVPYDEIRSFTLSPDGDKPNPVTGGSHCPCDRKLSTTEAPKKSKGRAASRPKADTIKVILDIETGDPDDLIALMFAACHPRVDLKAVTVTPGSEDQLLLVKHVLDALRVRRVRLGAQDWPKNRRKRGCADLKFYSRFLHPASDPKKKLADRPISGRMDASSVLPAAELIRDICAEHGNASLFTGGPLHNLGKALEMGASVPRWVAQGGFCGEGVVPDGVPVPSKFEGRTHVDTWNFGGAAAATELALSADGIGRRVLVGKNVCHRCQYDDMFDGRLRACIAEMPSSQHKSALEWIHKCLSSCYGGSQSKLAPAKAKKLHDPLAFATLLDEGVCTLREVAVERKGGAWGSVLCNDTRTFAAVDYSQEIFLDVLFAR